MNFTKLILILTAISAIALQVAAQSIDSDENWLKEIMQERAHYQFIDYKYDDYTPEDVPKAKQKFNIIKRAVPQNEWNGLYFFSLGLGEAQIFWNSQKGFFQYSFYHYLDRLDYGKTSETADYVLFQSEKQSKIFKNEKLIKVRVGEQHYLIPEKNLLDFSEQIAGLKTMPEEYPYYALKSTDTSKKSADVVTLPRAYKSFVRFPIAAQITDVGQGAIRSTNDDIATYKNFVYKVKVNAGRNKKLQPNMSFLVESTGDRVILTKVFGRTAVGEIRRSLDENKKEECLDETTAQLIPCRRIKAGMKIRTKSVYF